MREMTIVGVVVIGGMVLAGFAAQQIGHLLAQLLVLR